MNKLFSFLILLFSAVLLRAAEFGYPVNGQDGYFLRWDAANRNTPAGQWQVAVVLINGSRARDFQVFQNGGERYDKVVMSRQPYTLKIRCSWEGNREYDLRVILSHSQTKRTLVQKEKLQSPARRGYWNREWKNYLALLLSEENGCERAPYPVHATVGLLANYIRSANEIRVVKAEEGEGDVRYSEIPSQVYGWSEWNDPQILGIEEKDANTGQRLIRYHPTITFSIAFLARLRPREKATYLVFYNNPAAPQPAYGSDLKVSGQGLGKTIENSFYRVVLAPKSGMVYEIQEKATGLRLEHKLETNGALHWNPDVFSPPHAWSHTSDWENPPFEEESGPVFYSLRRSAPLPHLKDIQISITYHFYNQAPFILMTSLLEVKNDLHVMALRDGEIVFNKEVFDSVAYKGVDERVQEIDFASSRRHPDHVITLRPDIPWVTFFNLQKGIGFANLYLDLATPNLYGGDASLEQPYIYIQHGPWYYLARAFVYSFGSNNQTRMLPVKKGSVYYEKIAWIPFALRERGDVARLADRYWSMLKHPLAVREAAETYSESPPGWVVPILTEPFEEGVKGALGGKKK